MLGGVMLNSAPAQEAGDLVRLRKAGVGDEVLALIVKEKVIPTQALTVEEIIQLKSTVAGRLPAPQRPATWLRTNRYHLHDQRYSLTG